jgi:hypothetical protein
MGVRLPELDDASSGTFVARRTAAVPAFQYVTVRDATIEPKDLNTTAD